MTESLFAPEDIIYSYTRAQAVEDGEQVLCDTKLSKEAGFNYPVYLTNSVWNIIERAVANKKHHNDLDGVLWDILNMARLAARRTMGDYATFTVIITGASLKRNYQMVCQVGATDIDDPAPAVTIMFPEDN